jgi:hypothetical protein
MLSVTRIVIGNVPVPTGVQVKSPSMSDAGSRRSRIEEKVKI